MNAEVTAVVEELQDIADWIRKRFQADRSASQTANAQVSRFGV
jgi:hypothetical protein